MTQVMCSSHSNYTVHRVVMYVQYIFIPCKGTVISDATIVLTLITRLREVAAPFSTSGGELPKAGEVTSLARLRNFAGQTFSRPLNVIRAKG